MRQNPHHEVHEEHEERRPRWVLPSVVNRFCHIEVESNPHDTNNTQPKLSRRRPERRNRKPLDQDSKQLPAPSCGGDHLSSRQTEPRDGVSSNANSHSQKGGRYRSAAVSLLVVRHRQLQKLVVQLRYFSARLRCLEGVHCRAIVSSK